MTLWAAVEVWYKNLKHVNLKDETWKNYLQSMVCLICKGIPGSYLVYLGWVLGKLLAGKLSSWKLGSLGKMSLDCYPPMKNILRNNATHSIATLVRNFPWKNVPCEPDSIVHIQMKDSELKYTTVSCYVRQCF